MSWLKPLAATAALIVASLSFAETEQKYGEWNEETYQKDLDIRVFTREVANSDLKEFKGITHIKAPVSAFVALLKDTDVSTEWMKDVVEYEVLEQTSETESLVYTVNAAPWPVTNRDAVIRSIMSQDEQGVVTVQLSAEPEGKAKHDDYVRMPALTGFWQFTPQAEGVVEVVYQVHANPGGSLPTWLVNSIVVETPLETLGNLHGKVVKEKYQGQTFAFMQAAPKTEAATSEVAAEVAAE